MDFSLEFVHSFARGCALRVSTLGKVFQERCFASWTFQKAGTRMKCIDGMQEYCEEQESAHCRSVGTWGTMDGSWQTERAVNLRANFSTGNSTVCVNYSGAS
jgi:hypothetical protein